MAEITIGSLVEGGKASGGPPLGPALGPLGVNINAIVTEINEKTKAFDGIRVPVKVIVDAEKKTFRIEVGSPPTSALILKELGVKTGAKAKGEVVGNLTLQQVVKIAKAKETALYGGSANDRVTQVLGTCKSMGVTCDGEDPRVVIGKIKDGSLKV